METKIKTYAQMAENTVKRVTNNLTDWTDFLTTVGRLYKYLYYDQLMIYAQRPDARACAEYDPWNNTMNRYVRRGSKGIALLDTTADIPRLKYVFDVFDTGGRENSRYPYLWDMKEDHKEPILEMIKNKHNAEENIQAPASFNISYVRYCTSFSKSFRIVNALSAMSDRFKKVREQLDNFIKQQEAAKSEISKPFLQEEELKDKIARLAILDTELNMGIEVPNSKEEAEKKNPKSDRPSVLGGLKQSPQLNREFKVKQDKCVEVR